MSGRVTFKEPNLVLNIIKEYDNKLGKKERGYFYKNAQELNRHSRCIPVLKNIPFRFTEKYHSKPDEDYGEIYTAYRINYKGYDILVEDTSGEQEEITLVPDELFIIEE